MSARSIEGNPLNQRIRVLIVEDNPVNRLMARAMLDTAPDIVVVAEAVDGLAAVAKAEVFEPDVILMDLVMPVMGGVEASRRILARQQRTRIVALTSLEPSERVLAAVGVGVRGYVHKPPSLEQLLEAVRAVHKGELVFPTDLARMCEAL